MKATHLIAFGVPLSIVIAFLGKLRVQYTPRKHKPTKINRQIL